AARREAEQFLLLAKRLRHTQLIANFTITLQATATLEGRTRSRTSFSDDRFDEENHAAMVTTTPGLVSAANWYYLLKLIILFFAEDYAAALAVIAKLERPLKHPGPYLHYQSILFTCLTLAALYPTATSEEKQEYLATLNEYYARITRRANVYPPNFEHNRL